MRSRSIRRALVSTLPLLFAALPACDASTDSSVHVGVDDGSLAPKGGGTWAGGGGTWAGGGGQWGGGGSLFAGGGGFWSGGGGLWSGGGGLWGGGGGQWSGGGDLFAGGGGWWSGGGGMWNGGGGTWSGGGNWWNGGGGLWGAGGGTWSGGGGLWNGGFASAIPFVGWHGSRTWQYRGVPKSGGYQAAVPSTWPAFSTAADTTACGTGKVRLGGFATNFDADGWPGFLALGYSKPLCIPTPGNGGLRVQATVGDGSIMGIGGYTLGSTFDSAAGGQVAKDKYMVTSLVGVGATNIATQYGGALCASIGTLAAAKRSCAVGIAFSDPNTGRDGNATVRGVTVKTGAQASVASYNTPFGRPDGYGLYGEAAGDMESYANRVMQEHSLALPTSAANIDAWNDATFATTVSMKGSDFTPRGLSTSANASALLANINRSLVAPLDMVPVDTIASGTTVQNTERILDMNKSVNVQNGKMYALNIHSLAEQQNPLYGSGGGRWFFHDPSDPAAASKPLLDLSAVYQGTSRFLTGKFAFGDGTNGTLNNAYIADADVAYADWRPNPAGTFGIDHAAQWPTSLASDADREARLRAALTLRSQAPTLASGSAHNCAVLSVGGGVKCWGDNTYGQLGNGTSGGSAGSTTPVQVSGLTSGVVAVSASTTTSCAITTAGAAKCWGYNYYGQLGDGSTTNRSAPVQVSGLTSGIAAIQVGGAFACALTSAGAVKCWGNSYGSTPVQVSGLTSGAIAISAALTSACALLSTGAVKCWGTNEVGQLGDGTTTGSLTPVQVSGLTSGVVAISGSRGSGNGGHTCAIMKSGSLTCWGYNFYGQLGDGTTAVRTTPVPVSGLTSGVAAVVASNAHTCALLAGGTTQCWGSNASGQFGNGTLTNSTTPVATSFPNATGLSAANFGTCARSSLSGDVKCAGDNSSGQLGNGTTLSSTTPVVSSVGYTNGALVSSQASVLVQKFAAAAGSTISGHVMPLAYTMVNGTTGNQALMVTYDPLAAAAAMFIDQYQAHINACLATNGEQMTELDQQAGTRLWACSNSTARSAYLSGMQQFLMGAKSYLFGRSDGSATAPCSQTTSPSYCVDPANAHFPYTFVVPNYTSSALNGDPTVTTGTGAYYYSQLDAAIGSYRTAILGSTASSLHKSLQLAGVMKFDTNTSAIVTTRVKRSGAFGANCSTP